MQKRLFPWMQTSSEGYLGAAAFGEPEVCSSNPTALKLETTREKREGRAIPAFLSEFDRICRVLASQVSALRDLGSDFFTYLLHSDVHRSRRDSVGHDD
jgi:hypothetical protein